MLGLVFVVLALLTPFNDPGGPPFFAVQLSLNAAICFAIVLALRRWPPAPRAAHPIFSVLVALALSGSATQRIVQGDPLETVGFMFVGIAVGLFVTSVPWFLGNTVGVVLAWALSIELAAASPLDLPLGILFMQGLVLAATVFVVRLRGLRRIEALRTRDQVRTRELETTVKALGQSEARFRLMAENAQDIVYRLAFDPTPRVEYVSPSVETVMGYRPQEFYDRPELILDVIHPDDRKAIQGALKTSLSRPQAFRLLRKDGHVIHCEQHRRPFLSPEGKLVAIEGFIRDVTLQREAQEKLRESEERHRFLAENVSDMISLHDAPGNFLYVSPAVRKLLGYEPEEIVGRSPYEFFHEDEIPGIRAVHEEVARTPGERMVTLRLRRKDGTFAWVEVSTHQIDPQEGDGGRRFINTWRDITERKRIEEDLVRERDALQHASHALMEAEAIAHLGSAGFDIESDMVDASDEMRQIFGLGDPGPIPVETLAARIHEEDREFVLAALARARAEGAPWTLDYRVRRPDGSIRFVHGEGRAAPALPGSRPRIFATVLDVTEQKLAERRRAAQHAATLVLAQGSEVDEFTSKILEAVGGQLGWAFGAAWVVDETESALRCTTTWHAPTWTQTAFETKTRSLSLTRGEGAPGRVWVTRTAEWVADVSADARSPRAEAARREGLHGEFAFPVLADTRVLGVLEFFSTAVESPDPELLGLMSTVGGQIGQFIARRQARDEVAKLNTELRASLEALADKNRDLESFSASASHDLQAPLRAIDLLGGLLLEDEAERLSGSGRDALRRLRVETARMSQLVDDLLKLSRAAEGEVQRTRVDVGEIAREVLDELAQQEPTRDVDVVIASDLFVDADRRLLKVAMQNLIGNAWKYTSHVPRARIEVGKLPTTSANKAPTFFVRDNGAGFDMARAGKLFQPFQRLHGRKFPGTGIGLATVQRIIKRHGGRIWAEGAVDEGSTFSFTIPPATNGTHLDP